MIQIIYDETFSAILWQPSNKAFGLKVLKMERVVVEHHLPLTHLSHF